MTGSDRKRGQQPGDHQGSRATGTARTGRTRLLAVLAASVAVIGGIGLWGLRSAEQPAETVAVLLPDDPAVVLKGEEIYRVHCAACHGANLEGEANWRTPKATGRLPAPPHDATGHTWHHPGDQLFALTKYGVATLVGGGYESDMPAYGAILTDAEIRAVLSYIKATWPPEIRARHDQLEAAAARGG